MGEFRRVIDFYEQYLSIAREIGDVMGGAMTSFNLARLLSSQRDPHKTLSYAEYNAQVFQEVGHSAYAQKAQDLITKIRA